MLVSYGKSCPLCIHQKVCRCEKEFKDQAAALAEVLKPMSYSLLAGTLYIDCINYHPYPKEENDD